MGKPAHHDHKTVGFRRAGRPAPGRRQGHRVPMTRTSRAASAPRRAPVEIQAVGSGRLGARRGRGRRTEAGLSENDDMAKTKKPTLQPSLPFPTTPEALRKEWRDVTTKPEEVVRQKFIRTLVEHYGYALNLMDQEQRTQHGHKSPRADIVIWQSLDGRTAKRFPVLIVECKTDSIEFQERDYYQAASYTVAS